MTFSEQADCILDFAYSVPAINDQIKLARVQLEMDALKVKALDALCMKFDNFTSDFNNELHNTLHTALNRIT